jgi:phage gp36-like protein
MSDYFSSQTTIEAKVKAARIKIWGDRDRDGTLDSDTLDQALKFAKNRILGYVQTRFGSQVHDWVLADVPDVLREISDSLTLWYIAGGQNAMNDVIALNYKEAMTSLERMRDYEMDIPEVSDSDDYQTVTDDFDSDFENDDVDDDDWNTNPTFFPR